jgi:hypothetical protein
MGGKHFRGTPLLQRSTVYLQSSQTLDQRRQVLKALGKRM